MSTLREERPLVTGPEYNIAHSLTQASHAVQARREKISVLLDRHPDGYAISARRNKVWTKVTISGDVFWTDGRRHLSGGQLLETLGTTLVTSGAIHLDAYYGSE